MTDASFILGFVLHRPVALPRAFYWNMPAADIKQWGKFVLHHPLVFSSVTRVRFQLQYLHIGRLKCGSNEVDVKFIVQMTVFIPFPIIFCTSLRKTLRQVSYKSSSLVYHHLILLLRLTSQYSKQSNVSSSFPYCTPHVPVHK